LARINKIIFDLADPELKEIGWRQCAIDHPSRSAKRALVPLTPTRPERLLRPELKDPFTLSVSSIHIESDLNVQPRLPS